MKEKASIKKLIQENPSGLLELQQSLSIPEYRNNQGFNLKNTFKIYESKYATNNNKDWFAFLEKSLDKLFKVKEESDGDLLVVFIAEFMRGNNIYCYLVLSDEAFKNMINDKRYHLLKVCQMYSSFFDNDYIKLNKTV